MCIKNRAFAQAGGVSFAEDLREGRWELKGNFVAKVLLLTF